MLHRHTLDRRRPGEVRVERRHLVHGAEQHVVMVEEPPYAFQQLAVAHHRRGDVSAAQRGPGRDFLDELGLHQRALAGEQRPIHGRGAPAANGEEDVVGGSQVGTDVLDDAAERLERGSLGVEHGPHARVERQPAKVGRPGDAQPAQVAGEVAGEHGRVRSLAARIARIDAGHRAEEKRHVGDGARHRPVDAEAEPRERVWGGRHQADRRPQRDDVVEVGGVAQRAAEIAPIGNGQHARGQRRAGSAARPAGALAEVVGVPCDAVDLVVGVRAQPELGDIGLADAEGPGVPQPFDQHRIGPGDVAGIDTRPARAHQALGILQVLERDRQPM